MRPVPSSVSVIFDGEWGFPALTTALTTAILSEETGGGFSIFTRDLAPE